MPSAQPSVRSYLGIAKEITKGTAVPPTDFIPINKDSFKPTDIIDALYDTGLRGSMAENYRYTQGRRHTTTDLGGVAFPDTIGYWLGGIMGSVVTTGATAPYTHAITLKNATSGDAQPTSFTLTDYYVAGNRYYPGCQITDFTLTFNADGQLEYTTKAMGFPTSTVAATAPTFSTAIPTPVWEGTVSVGGATIGYTSAGSITMTRKSEVIYGIGNSQGPYEVFVGALDVSGSFTFVMEDDAQLTNFLDNTQPALVVAFAQGAGASATNISFTVSKGAYTTATIDRSADHVTLSVDVQGIATTTDAGTTGGFAPIKWSLQNAVVSGTYQ
jgi:hypothetical protein